MEIVQADLLWCSDIFQRPQKKDQQLNLQKFLTLWAKKPANTKLNW